MSLNTKSLQKRLELLEMTIATLNLGEGHNSLENDRQVAGVAQQLQPFPRAQVNDPVRSRSVSSQAAGGLSKASILMMVEAVIAARRHRLAFFEADFFFDPSWSILLDLFRAELREDCMSVSSVCYGSGVPGTTALRYIRMMEDRDYIERAQDPSDKRRVFLRLTPKASERLTAYFTKVGPGFNCTVPEANRGVSRVVDKA